MGLPAARVTGIAANTIGSKGTRNNEAIGVTNVRRGLKATNTS